jgi:hypothetical protein
MILSHGAKLVSHIRRRQERHWGLENAVFLVSLVLENDFYFDTLSGGRVDWKNEEVCDSVGMDRRSKADTCLVS